jgi:hypothetical protein
MILMEIPITRCSHFKTMKSIITAILPTINNLTKRKKTRCNHKHRKTSPQINLNTTTTPTTKHNTKKKMKTVTAMRKTTQS